ncbi:hypothetical protein [Corynebacterium cystitidis]|nr:hypothetical protein [Corynebacterium cystitidis]SNV66173.1 Uncharacterised protein [Corynebacterium cystitidis]
MADRTNKALVRRHEAEADAITTNSRIDEKAVPRGQWLSAMLIVCLFALTLVALILDRGWAVALFGVGGLSLMLMNTLPTLMNRNHKAGLPDPSEEEGEEKPESPENG